ncbi:MAG: hypothetical protein HC914_02510 [Chloroflexaceae bacterium]|nr:hypothetical protein [Chloroflexaceae bacterium]
MPITIVEYTELPAPRAAVVALLSDPTVWATLPTGATHAGTFWHRGADLYRVTTSGPYTADGHSTLRWEFALALQTTPTLQLEIVLYDAVLVTHAHVRVHVLAPSAVLPWQQWPIQQQVQRTLAACIATLKTRLRAAQPAPTVPHPSRNSNGKASLVEQLRPYYPQTVAHFEQMGALDHLEQVWRLERGWERILQGTHDPSIYAEQPAAPAAPLDYDLIYAGGGLGLLHAAAMAQCYGWRVLLFDRAEVGSVHREWNISRDELQALVTMGLVTWDELAPVIMAEYRDGVVRFAAGPHSRLPEHALWMPTVLNMALDAGALLRLMRRKLLAAGGTILDYRSFKQVSVSSGAPLRVTVALETLPDRRREHYTARLLLDGMGSTSPLALLRHAGQPFAGVCPTVGTVARGFVAGSGRSEFDPTIGDILVSTTTRKAIAR